MHAPPLPGISEIYGRHAGEDVYVVGYGTSLVDFDWTRLYGRTTIALNDAITQMPHATYHLYSDKELCQRYWHHPYAAETTIVVQHESISLMRAVAGWRYLPQVREFIRVVEQSISAIKRFTDELWVQRTVAAPGVMLAWKLGAARVFLLGVDGYRQPDGSNYADRKSSAQKFSVAYTTEHGLVVEDRHVCWAKDMLSVRHYLEEQRDQYRQSIPEVWNLSEHSTITAWPKKPMSEVL
jgi:hypothetical protein